MASRPHHLTNRLFLRRNVAAACAERDPSGKRFITDQVNVALFQHGGAAAKKKNHMFKLHIANGGVRFPGPPPRSALREASLPPFTRLVAESHLMKKLLVLVAVLALASQFVGCSSRGARNWWFRGDACGRSINSLVPTAIPGCCEAPDPCCNPCPSCCEGGMMTETGIPYMSGYSASKPPLEFVEGVRDSYSPVEPEPAD